MFLWDGTWSLEWLNVITTYIWVISNSVSNGSHFACLCFFIYIITSLQSPFKSTPKHAYFPLDDMLFLSVYCIVFVTNLFLWWEFSYEIKCIFSTCVEGTNFINGSKAPCMLTFKWNSVKGSLLCYLNQMFQQQTSSWVEIDVHVFKLPTKLSQSHIMLWRQSFGVAFRVGWDFHYYVCIWETK
jgi:hypothetical protein